MVEMNDQQWANIVGEYSGAYADAQEYGAGFEPAPGEYTAFLVGRRRGTDNKGVPYVSIEVEMVDGIDPSTGEEYSGQRFSPFYFAFAENRIGFLKGFVKQLHGESVNDLAACTAIIEEAVGRALTITFRAKMGDKGRLNFFLLSVERDADDEMLPETAGPTPETEAEPDPEAEPEKAKGKAKKG